MRIDLCALPPTPSAVKLDPAILARALPFALFLAFVGLANVLGGGTYLGLDSRWLYPVKVVLVGLVLAFFWRRYGELAVRIRPAALLQAVLVGLGVFFLWINLDRGWLDLGGGMGYDPRRADGSLDAFLVAFRLGGAALLVPIMEELFWRSFLMRWVDRHDFLSLPAAQTSVKAVAISSVLFGTEHTLWFAGILAGVAYAMLYRRHASLWSPIVAHATTNLALGLWVLHRGAWQFW